MIHFSKSVGQDILELFVNVGYSKFLISALKNVLKLTVVNRDKYVQMGTYKISFL